MKTVAEVMSHDVTSVAPDDSIRHAAELMDDLNVGALPVTAGQRLLGMVTDRDITVRATAAGLGPEETSVEEVMSEELRLCYADQNIDTVLEHMRELRIRRMPVVSRDQHTLIGIVALADLLGDAETQQQAAGVLGAISAPYARQRGAPPA
jgi:CBS domain-containing protein